MIIPIATQLELDRWYPLIEHPQQLAMVRDTIRFKCVPAGRRSGKTERFKRFIAKICMGTANRKYFIAAPTSAQVEKIYWQDMKLLSFSSLLTKSPSESKKIIFYNNGTELHLVSLDKPDRIEGVNWDGGGIDEFASCKSNAWANLSPLFDTQVPGRNEKPWCWFLGVPDGLNHYYDLCQNSNTMADWKTYTWFSSEILPPDIIEAAKARMSAKQFRVEYEASFEGASGRIYEDYCKDNYTTEIILDHEVINYFCDFNFTPNSHGVGVVRKEITNIDNTAIVDKLYILDDIVIESATGAHNALEFCERYKHHKNKQLRLYGDRSGRNGEKHALVTEYLVMEKIFRDHGWSVERRVKDANPSIKDSQNEVRAMICNAQGLRRLFVNPEKAVWMHKGLSTVQVMKGSTYLEDDKNQYQHITTALRYWINYEYPLEDSIIDTSMMRYF
jgi:hypothetical protein